MPDTTHVPCVSEQAGGGLTPFERALRGKAKRKAGFSGMQGRWTRDGYTRIFRCQGAVGELRVEPLQADLFRVN